MVTFALAIGVLLLGLMLFAALWHFGTAMGGYHTSGDPKQVHSIDERTGDRIPNAPSAVYRREVD